MAQTSEAALSNLRPRIAALILLAASALCASVAQATALGVTAATAMPGETVSVFVTIDAVPLTPQGGFSIDLDLAFDGGALEVQQVLAGDLATPAFFYQVDLVGAGSAAPLRLALTAAFISGGGVPQPPGGGTLFEIVFRVADTAAGGAQPVTLTLLNSAPAFTPTAVTAGEVTVAASLASTPEPVPLPPIFWPVAFLMMATTGVARLKRG